MFTVEERKSSTLSGEMARRSLIQEEQSLFMVSQINCSGGMVILYNGFHCAFNNLPSFPVKVQLV